MSDQPSDVSRLFAGWREEGREAVERLMPLPHSEPRALVAGPRSDWTLARTRLRRKPLGSGG